MLCEKIILHFKTLSVFITVVIISALEMSPKKKPFTYEYKVYVY